VTVRELAAMVAKIAGVRLKVTEAPLPPDDPQRRCPDIGRAISELKWRPVVRLDTGLRETLAYFRTELGSRSRGSS
jgi:UDP-glucuronate decarboxylase